MSRKKKKKRHIQELKNQKKKPEIFNPALKGMVLKKTEVKQPGKGTGKKEDPGDNATSDEAIVFLEAMQDVKPLSGKTNVVTRTPDATMTPAHAAKNDELEVIAHLHDLIRGTAELDITFSDEYIEGCVPGFGQKMMQKLKKGQFPIQDYIDLHGLTKQEAEIRIRDFLIQSHRLGLRCVLVVHGRGLNSENHIPVLKERLPIWLSRGSIKKIILAFSTARPYDGGTGAIYILLRRRK